MLCLLMTGGKTGAREGASHGAPAQSALLCRVQPSWPSGPTCDLSCTLVPEPAGPVAPSCRVCGSGFLAQGPGLSQRGPPPGSPRGRRNLLSAAWSPRVLRAGPTPHGHVHLDLESQTQESRCVETEGHHTWLTRPPEEAQTQAFSGSCVRDPLGLGDPFTWVPREALSPAE